MKNKYKISTFIVSFLICLIVISLHLLSHERTQEIYLQQTENTIVSLKADFLKDTVNNIILEIDRLRETKNISYQKNTKARQKRFQEELYINEKEFIKVYTDIFNEDLESKMWTAFLWDVDNKEVLYDSSGLEIDTIENAEETLKILLASYAVIEEGNIKGIFGVSKNYIENIVKYEVGDMVRNRKFSNESYIWVNEIVNYEGGENYAIRRFHPNLRDSEGSYLSTDMKDIKGSLPYLEELEGIKKNGEIVFTYHFKKLNSEQISEKITFAKLYKDYDWIIAMGVHLDDIEEYTERTNSEIKNLASKSSINLLGFILLVLLFGFIVLYFIEKRHLLISTRSLEKEINIDSLTKASNRRCGEINLSNFFKKYKVTGEKPAIMMLDIDNFKEINDKYGHEVGDFLLKEIVKKINHIIRSSDQLIRWGGDEFIAILPGLKEEYIMEFGEKLLAEVNSIRIPIGNEKISVTISIGFSYFKEVDSDYNDVLKRADTAMYKSKQQGKSRVSISL